MVAAWGPQKSTEIAFDWGQIEQKPASWCPTPKRLTDLGRVSGRSAQVRMSVGAIIEITARGVPAGLGGCRSMAKLDTDLAAGDESIKRRQRRRDRAKACSAAMLTGEFERRRDHMGADGPVYSRTMRAVILGGISHRQDIGCGFRGPKPTSEHPDHAPKTHHPNRRRTTGDHHKGRHDRALVSAPCPVGEASDGLCACGSYAACIAVRSAKKSGRHRLSCTDARIFRTWAGITRAG